MSNHKIISYIPKYKYYELVIWIIIICQLFNMLNTRSKSLFATKCQAPCKAITSQLFKNDTQDILNSQLMIASQGAWHTEVSPGSSSHSKIVYWEAPPPIELQFGNVDFWGPENLYSQSWVKN